MLDISADKIAFIIIRAREAEEAGRPGGYAGELREFIGDLNEDEQAALTAVMWIGRGTFDADDFEEAVATARAEKTTPTEDYLMGSPHLADHLESGMEALGLSPDEAEDDLRKY